MTSAERETIMASLFQNEVDGDDDICCVLDSILAAPMALRGDLATGIVLCGGNALIPGISRFEFCF